MEGDVVRLASPPVLSRSSDPSSPPNEGLSVATERNPPESELTDQEERFAAYEEMEPSAPVVVAEEAPVLKTVPAAEATLTLEEAAARLSPKVLQALEDKFNGSLIQVRATDEKDQLF